MTDTFKEADELRYECDRIAYKANLLCIDPAATEKQRAAFRNVETLARAIIDECAAFTIDPADKTPTGNRHAMIEYKRDDSLYLTLHFGEGKTDDGTPFTVAQNGAQFLVRLEGKPQVSFNMATLIEHAVNFAESINA